MFTSVNQGTLPPLASSALSFAKTEKKKAVDYVPDDWKPMVDFLQNNSSASRMLTLTGYMGEIMPDDGKFKSPLRTFTFILPVATWKLLAQTFFTKFVDVPIDQLETFAKDAPFTVKVKPTADGEYVVLTLKAHPIVLDNAVLADGQTGITSGDPVTVVLLMNVYAPFNDNAYCGVSLKVGQICQLAKQQ